MLPFARLKEIEPPAMPAATAMDLAQIAGDLRRGLKIRQADLARRAGVSRQWIVAMEQGKPTLEVGLVLRTLEVLGLELTLKPLDPPGLDDQGPARRSTEKLRDPMPPPRPAQDEARGGAAAAVGGECDEGVGGGGLMTETYLPDKTTNAILIHQYISNAVLAFIYYLIF